MQERWQATRLNLCLLPASLQHCIHLPAHPHTAAYLDICSCGDGRRMLRRHARRQLPQLGVPQAAWLLHALWCGAHLAGEGARGNMRRHED